jgi:ubiquinone/menaquinone biosynthesis C-methylase UbiE
VQQYDNIEAVSERMQREWNERAREDAHFYVAFGRRDQDNDEFFETAREMVTAFEYELRRLPSNANRRAWRALEIGCGPGRLIKPLSRNFGEIHGVDVSDEMIARARTNLRGIPHAHVHHTTGADLAAFADDSFDFVYSYAVFQHIPSREVVMQYLREARRVLKPGGLLRAQINGLDETAARYDTWSGVRISADEVAQFARENSMQLLALEGTRTQYMWTSMRKQTPGWRHATHGGRARIRRITNAFNSEPVAPASGRFSSITLWMEDLPADCDLNSLDVRIGNSRATACYIGPSEGDGLQQVNVLMPRVERTGLLPVQVLWNDIELCDTKPLRVVPPAPAVPFVVSVTDGINMLAKDEVVTGTVKVTIEEAANADAFRASVDGAPVSGIDVFCADPRPPRHEINFHLPKDLAAGLHNIQMSLGDRTLGAYPITVTKIP